MRQAERDLRNGRREGCLNCVRPSDVAFCCCDAESAESLASPVLVLVLFDGSLLVSVALRFLLFFGSSVAMASRTLMHVVKSAWVMPS